MHFDNSLTAKAISGRVPTIRYMILPRIDRYGILSIFVPPLTSLDVIGVSYQSSQMFPVYDCSKSFDQHKLTFVLDLASRVIQL